MIRKTVSAMGSSALLAAGVMASGSASEASATTPGVANLPGEVRGQIVLGRDEAVARAEAATGARALDVSHAGEAGQGFYGIELTRADRSLVLVLVSEMGGEVHLLDMGDDAPLA